MDSGSVLAFIAVAFCMALILIMKKDTIAPPFRRMLALLTLVMVVFAFFLIVYSFFSLGQ